MTLLTYSTITKLQVYFIFYLSHEGCDLRVCVGRRKRQLRSVMICYLISTSLTMCI
jgi:hypothetical protein